jgi:hypothetical protein
MADIVAAQQYFGQVAKVRADSGYVLDVLRSEGRGRPQKLATFM